MGRRLSREEFVLLADLAAKGMLRKLPRKEFWEIADSILQGGPRVEYKDPDRWRII